MKLLPKSHILAIIAAIWFAAAGTVYGASTTVSATATVQTATITLTTVTDLDFGTIVATGGANILIDASAGAAVSTVDSGTATITSAGTSGRVNVDSPVSATVNVAYSIASTTGAVADQIDDGGGNTMAFTAASIGTYSSSTGGNPGTLSVTAGTTAPIYIGGLLQIGVGQTAGTYTGTITVDVTY